MQMVKDDPRPCRLVLPDRHRRILEAGIRRTHCPQAIAVRARVVLAAAGGTGMSEVGREVGCSRELARRWRDRFARGQAEWGTAAGEWDDPTLADKVVSLLEDR